MFEFIQKESFAARERRILAFWKEKEVFKHSLKQREGSLCFSFYDGPPFATGLPHYGHLLAGTIKDVVPRYKTMQGFFVPRRFGWDCHGLPVENEIEKAKELSGAPAIEAFGLGAFNEECRSIVLRYTQEWKDTVERMGRWVDFDATYKTMDLPFMESVFWVFSQLYAKGLIYEGFKVMPFSAKLGTPLSNFEANLNYKDVDDPSLTLLFPLKEDPNTSFLVWTTTPWTLPSNLALAVGQDLIYVKVKEKKSGRVLILAKERLKAYFKEESSFDVMEEVLGRELVGKPYEPLFPYFAFKKQASAFKVLAEESVGEGEGTGIVHMAPAFGEVDFYACLNAGIELVCPVDHNGKFTSEIPEFAGLFVKDADKEIIKRLKAEGKVFHHGQIRHRYPFCWRSDTPLIYRAVRTWFVAVEKLKDKLLQHNASIHWTPEHIKEGRFGKWLENARDWAISRNRYWGTPIPIWRAEDGEIIVIGSIKELEERTGEKITDLHRHFIDELTFTENGKVFKRIKEVFDCWFESGSMPYAQNHFPFENQESTLERFPADFIAEGLDQTRGWFYTLHVLSVALFDSPAFKNVIVNGIILAEDGNKMSKRLKNYPEPSRVIEEYGADAIRLFFLSSPVVVAEDTRFSEAGVEQVMRSVLIPLWNAFVFLSTYASICNWSPSNAPLAPSLEIDRWILSRLQKLIQEVTGAMDRYALKEAISPIILFVDELTNWYIRRSRPRFWSTEKTRDQQEAFETLTHVLKTVTLVSAPFIPFLSEAIYLQLRKKEEKSSVHLCDYPQFDVALYEKNLEAEMEIIKRAVSLAHGLRKEHALKVRQPLSKAYLVTTDESLLKALVAHKLLISEELNVREVEFSSEETRFVSLTCKPNFRILGKKVGAKMKSAQATIGAFHQKQMQTLFEGSPLKIELEGEQYFLESEDVAIERKVKEGLVAATEGGITIALDTTLDESLLLEGIARELVNKINMMRKEAGFYVTDRIVLALNTTDKIKQAFEEYKSYVMGETLAVEALFEKPAGASVGGEWDINGEKTEIYIRPLAK